MKIRLLITVALAMAVFSGVKAEDQTNFQFDRGSVLIRCMAPEGHPQITTELFNAAFPYWITSLQEQANEGLISRAHYLGELKEGVFIVVVGEDREESMANAEIVVNELNLITAKAFADSGVEPSYNLNDACQFIEIGPVAVLPMK